MTALAPSTFPLYYQKGGFPIEDHAILRDTARALNARSALEFGPGKSTLALIEAGCTRIVSYEHDPLWEARARERFAGTRAVEIRRYRNTPEIRLTAETFDIAFVDAPVGTGRRWLQHPGQEGCSRLNTLLAALERAPVVLLHDAHRAGEQESLRRLAALGHTVEMFNTRKGVAKVCRHGV